MEKMLEGMRVVEFIALLMERIASRFKGTMTSHDITSDSGSENTTISLVFFLPNRQNVVLESLFKATIQVFGASQRMQKRELACGKDSSPSMNTPPPPPLVSAHFGRCLRLVDPIPG